MNKQKEKYIKVESVCFDITVDSLRNEKTPKGFVAVLLINHEDEVIEAEMSLKNLQAFMELAIKQNNEK